MKKFLIGLFILLALFPFIGITQEPSQHRTATKTYSLLPAKTLNIINRVSHEIDIRSEYPVQIAAGPCHADYTVQWHCSLGEPTDLFIRDLRTPPVFSTPRANVITITASQD
jgi:hypothetical protein